jgi:hypothetical protein
MLQRRKLHLSLLLFCISITILLTSCSATPVALNSNNAAPSTAVPSTAVPSTATVTQSAPAATATTPPAVSTACPANGGGRVAVMPPLQLGQDQNIVFVENLSAILLRYDIQTGVTATILNEAGSIGNPQISTDGQWILFTLVTNNTYKLQLVRMDGEYLQTLYCAPADSLINDDTNVQWSPKQNLVIFDLTHLNTNITSLDLLNLQTGSVQVELTSPNAQTVYVPRTWVDNTHVYIITTTSPSQAPETLLILDTGQGANQPSSDLQLVAGISDVGWDFDSTYDGSKLFMAYADPTAGRSGPGTYCQIHASTTSGQNSQVIFTSNTLVPSQIRVAGSGSSTLLLSVNRPGDPADKDNGLWKVQANGTGLVELTKQPNLFNPFTQYPWSNVSRDGEDYVYGNVYGPLSGGATTTYNQSNDIVVGWTTM